MSAVVKRAAQAGTALRAQGEKPRTKPLQPSDLRSSFRDLCCLIEMVGHLYIARTVAAQVSRWSKGTACMRPFTTSSG